MNEIEHPGLYVHVPFCRTKCPYCDFFSLTSLSLTAQWLDGILREAVIYRDRFEGFDSLYLGGGTPSLLNGSQLSTLTDGLFRHFSFSPGSEMTIEANPDDITDEKLGLLKDLGFNRMSLGVQSFDDRDLRILKRRHSAQRSERAVERIRAAGFTNLSLDLIYGVPGQSESAWIRTLRKALAFNPEHLSCYQMTIPAGTPFGEMLARGEIMSPGEERERAFFLLTAEILEERGYIHYEISNFARGRSFEARHNRKYWHHVPYLGLGPSAHSFSDGSRWWNRRSLPDYCRALSLGTPPVAGMERLSHEQRHLENLYLGFRTRDGVGRNLLADRPGADKILRDLAGSGLITFQGEKVIPTREGFLVADSLPLLFSG
jgi:putative oxygen-independent coproporphyrinogen III oxidase